MKKIALQIILLLMVVSCTQKNTYDIAYEISHNTIDSIAELRVKARFKPNSSGFTTLYFQNNAWGENDLFNCLSGLTLADNQGEIIKVPDSNRIEIKHAKDLDFLEFEYVLKQDTKLPLNTKKSYRPIIQPEYFSVFTHSLLMFPEVFLDQETINMKLNWKVSNNSHIVHNSFGSKLKEQVINTTPDKLLSAVFAGGDYRVHSFKIKNNDIHLATRGDWVAFEDSLVVNLLKKTIQVQREFWDDHSQEYFTVTMLPIPQENGSSFQGTGLTNSFATTVSNNEFMQLEGLAYLFNHELLHNWIGHTIEKANEEEQYWFSEGFTDYYTNKNIASNNILNLDAAFFIQQINEIVALLYNSPVKNAPNSEINYENFWASRDYEKLPYRRGAVFAFYLDLKIAKDSQNKYNLDDLMNFFLKDAREKGQKIDHPYFVKATNNFLKEDIKSFFETHLINGSLFDLQSIYKEFDLDYDEFAEVFDRGFTANMQTNTISDVIIDSNAYKAGLRKGDKITYMSVYSDAKKQAEVGVMRDNKQIDIKFYPARKIKVPQLIDNKKTRKNLPF